jgi:multidrug efflux pump subunit AcrA (membrane-fusion protein)
MSQHRKIKTWLFLILVGVLLIAGCDQFPTQNTPTPVPVEEEDVTPVVSATGIVVPTQWTTPSMSTAGLVEEVLVKEGDEVEGGQVLVRLKGREDLQASIAASKFEVSAAQKALDDLYESAETAKTQALDEISIYTKQVRDAQYQLDNYIVPTDQAEMEPMEAVETTKERLDQAREAFEPYKYRASGDPVREDLKEDLDQAQSEYNVAVRRLEYATELEVAQAKLDQAREDYETYQQGPDPSSVGVAVARLENAEAALAAAQSALKDLELAALFSGTVTQVYLRTGEWVTPGQPALQLADLNHLRVETTDLNEIDAAQVKPGNPATVTFDALVEEVVQGTVKSIAPKASEGTGVNYTVVIDLDELPDALRWGMTAFVDIEVE